MRPRHTLASKIGKLSGWVFRARRLIQYNTFNNSSTKAVKMINMVRVLRLLHSYMSVEISIRRICNLGVKYDYQHYGKPSDGELSHTHQYLLQQTPRTFDSSNQAATTGRAKVLS